MRGQCYAKMGDYKRALYDYSAAILNDDKHPKWNTLVPGVGGAPTYYMYGGICNYNLGQYEEALQHYDRAIREYNGTEGHNLAMIYYNRGLSNSSLMRFEEAIEDHNNSIRAMGDNLKVFKMRF